MSQVRRYTMACAIGCALLALLAAGCSKKNGAAFDPDSGHPDDYISLHPAEYRATPGPCTQCHGANLMGGISRVSCTTASRDGQGCHPGGPGGHTDGWLSAHSRSDSGLAAQCAVCHDNSSNSLPPGCFNNSLCHGAQSPHSAGWRTAHQSTSQSAATACAACHPDKGTPSCFTVSSCHGGGSGHPPFWLAGSQHGLTSIAAPGAASGLASCSPCHGTTFGGGTGPSCLTCHGGAAPHPNSNWAGGGGRHTGVNTGNTAACARCHGAGELEGSTNCLTTNGCHNN